MKKRMQVLVSLLVLTSYVSCAKADGRYDADSQQFEDEAYGEDAAGGSYLDSQKWQELRVRLQRHVDPDSLLRARRWGNIVNGLLLSVTGPVVLAVSTFGLKLSHIVLSLYVTAFGGLLTGIELGLSPVAPWVAENLSYLMTGSGRTAILTFAGNLVWAFGRTGLVPALITCLNAVFNANFQKIMSFVQEGEIGSDPSGEVDPLYGGGDTEQAYGAAEREGGFDDRVAAAEDVPPVADEPEAELNLGGMEALRERLEEVRAAAAAQEAAAVQEAAAAQAAAPAEDPVDDVGGGMDGAGTTEYGRYEQPAEAEAEGAAAGSME